MLTKTFDEKMNIDQLIEQIKNATYLSKMHKSMLNNNV